MVSSDNLEALEKLMVYLKAKSYSTNTLRTYRNEFIQFLKYLKDKPTTAVTPEALTQYMAWCIADQKITENTAHSRLNALKCYYEQVLKREKFFYDIPRPKKHLQLPKVLGEGEITRLFRAPSMIYGRKGALNFE